MRRWHRAGVGLSYEAVTVLGFTRSSNVPSCSALLYVTHIYTNAIDPGNLLEIMEDYQTIYGRRIYRDLFCHKMKNRSRDGPWCVYLLVNTISAPDIAVTQKVLRVVGYTRSSTLRGHEADFRYTANSASNLFLNSCSQIQKKLMRPHADPQNIEISRFSLQFINLLNLLGPDMY